MDRPLTENEKTLCEVLIPWLTVEMVTRLMPDTPMPVSSVTNLPGCLYNFGESNFEHGTAALERAGVLVSMGNIYYRVLERAKGSPIIPDGFGREGLDELLLSLAHHSNFIDELWRTFYEIIEPRSLALKNICQALVDCSYMEAISDDSFIWTERFAPWHISASNWNFSDVTASTESTVDKALSAAPKETLKYLSDPILDPPTFLTCFFRYWTGEDWSDGSQWKYTPLPSNDWDMPLARGVYLRLQGDQND